MVKELEDQLKCLICLDTYTTPKILQCNHVYCQGCLRRLVDRNRQGQLNLTCPTCRQATPVPAGGVKGLPPAFMVNKLLEILQKAIEDTPWRNFLPNIVLTSFPSTFFHDWLQVLYSLTSWMILQWIYLLQNHVTTLTFEQNHTPKSVCYCCS